MSRRPLRPRRTFADHPDGEQRHGEHEDAVALRVVDRADVVAEQVGVADLGALDAAGVVAVAEQHQLDRRAETERDDREVDAPRADRRETEDQAERNGGGHAGHEPEQERDVEHGDQTTGDVGAEPGDGVLRERELAGVAGEHDDRQQHDRDPERHGDRVDPLGLLGQHHEDDHAGPEDRPVPRHASVADHRQFFQEVVAQRQRTTAEHQDDDDDDERQRRCRDPGWSVYRPTTVWPTPSASPAAVAIGNDRKSPTSAAASAASTSAVIAVTCSVMIGTTRMPATAAMAEPSAQLRIAIRFGETPTADADRSLSDTASVARPNWLERYSSQSPAADAPRCRAG